MVRKAFLFFLAVLVLALILSAAALANSGNPSATAPSSGNTATGPAAQMFGNATNGLTIFNNNCASCHGPAGEPTDASYPGLNDVQNPNPSYSIDPGLYDINPVFFARNIDPFLQHGSTPGGGVFMPAFGDNSMLTQAQIADAEAYVMSLSHVNWPVLTLSGTSMTGSSFQIQPTTVPPSTVSVQLYLNNTIALGSGMTPDSSGNLAATTVPATPGIVTAAYASLNVHGIRANGSILNPELGLDGSAGAYYSVALKSLSDYFWTWYDNVGGNNWVLLANPATTSEIEAYSLKIGATNMGNTAAPPDRVFTPQFAGLIGGPVEAQSLTGWAGVLSQRTLWPKGGSSLEEEPATLATALSDHYFWTWYDMASPGFSNWVLVANPSASTTVHAVITFTNRLNGSPVRAESDIAPGHNWNPTFPGDMGGPVELKAYKSGGSWPANKMNVIASQRVLSDKGSAFNEVAGIPADSITSDYHWTWYDDASAGASDWVLVANPGVDHTGASQGTIAATVKIGGRSFGPYSIAPGGDVTPNFPGVIGGPVEVTVTGGDAIISQRSIWGPSFEEVPGSASLASDYHWTWYDESEPGVRNWVMIANPNTSAVHYQVLVSGNVVTQGNLGPGAFAIPEFPGTIGGPVEVTASGNVVASQRVLWNGFFNEVLGTVITSSP